MIAEKLDLAKSDKDYYTAKKSAQIVELGSYPYLTIQGIGPPETPSFEEAIRKVYKIAYTIKFMQKEEDLDFKVPKMECEWFIEGGPKVQDQFKNTPREEWCWKIHIRVPISVTQQVFEEAGSTIRSKKKTIDISAVKFEIINQGKSVQCLHVGSYENEESTIIKIHELIDHESLTIQGYHKEIYLSDPRKSPEEKLRTILRYPVG
ncbi:MAG: GyrI-like domain-containing protein [Reichenbachiella sp.]